MFSSTSRSSSSTRRPRSQQFDRCGHAGDAGADHDHVGRVPDHSTDSGKDGEVPRVTHRYHSRHEQPPQAARVAVAARGAAGRARGAGIRPASAPAADIVRADVVRTVRALGLLQIDSVNVLVRSHYLPLFSRLGAYAHAAAGRSGLRRPPATAVRVLGSRGVADAGRVPAVAALAHAAREERRRHLGQRRAIRPRACRLLRRGARGDPRPRPARRLRDRRPATAARAAGGAGARARSRSSGCSGPDRSPRIRGDASSACTT